MVERAFGPASTAFFFVIADRPEWVRDLLFRVHQQTVRPRAKRLNAEAKGVR